VPWIPLDRTTLDQTATVPGRREAWLLGGEPDALSRGEDDPDGVVGWVGTLADHLRHRAQEADSWL